jgi:hypothetical protein
MSDVPDDLDPEEERLRDLQARALVQAYTEKFGIPPESVEDAVAKLASGELDNLPLTPDGKIDVAAWEAKKGR